MTGSSPNNFNNINDSYSKDLCIGIVGAAGEAKRQCSRKKKRYL